MSFDAVDADELVRLVREVARTEIMPRFRRPAPIEVAEKSNALDLVTEADLASEAALTAGIAAAFSGAAIVGEEAVAADKAVLDRVARPGRTFVLDPIDGTWNFAKGQAAFGVIVSVIEDGEIVYGMHHDPVMDDWVWAGLGRGAHWSREGHTRPLATATPRDVPRMTGFLPMHLLPVHQQPRMASLYPRFARAMSLRCSAHEYRMIAEGHVDFSLNAMLNVWDHAAGVLIVAEAGGHCALIDGRPYAPAMRQGHLLTAASRDNWNRLAGMFAFLDEGPTAQHGT